MQMSVFVEGVTALAAGRLEQAEPLVVTDRVDADTSRHGKLLDAVHHGSNVRADTLRASTRSMSDCRHPKPTGNIPRGSRFTMSMLLPGATG